MRSELVVRLKSNVAVFAKECIAKLITKRRLLDRQNVCFRLNWKYTYEDISLKVRNQ